MKKLFLFVLAALFLSQSERALSQSLSVDFPDTLVYGPAVAGSSLPCWSGDWVTNRTASSVDVDVVRLMDDVATPGWTSAFCFKACQQPTTDSIRCTLFPYDSVNMAVHLIITSLPDSGTVMMKIKNVSNPSETYVQRFHGVSQLDFGVHDQNANAVRVNIFPSPAIAGTEFNMNIANVKTRSGDLSLELCNIYGNIVTTFQGLKEGGNRLFADVAAGIYSYRLMSGNSTIHSGKLAVIR